jgi:hypothetical protein
MSALQRLFRLAPPAIREESLAGDPLQWINRHEIHIAEKSSMLESIIEDEEIAEILFFRQDACGMPI